MQAPNQGGKFDSDKRADGFLPLTGSPSPIQRNEGAGGDRRGGSYPLAGSASPINPPNAKGDMRGGSLAFETPTAIEPGKGAVPVNPGIAGIGTMPVSVMNRGK